MASRAVESNNTNNGDNYCCYGAAWQFSEAESKLTAKASLDWLPQCIPVARPSQLVFHPPLPSHLSSQTKHKLAAARLAAFFLPSAHLTYAPTHSYHRRPLLPSSTTTTAAAALSSLARTAACPPRPHPPCQPFLLAPPLLLAASLTRRSHRSPSSSSRLRLAPIAASRTRD